MPNAELTPEQSFALIDELETAAKLTQHGLDALHGLDAANDFHHLPMQLLSQGFERLLKVTYALAIREHSGELPTVPSLPTSGETPMIRELLNPEGVNGAPDVIDG